MKNNIKSSLLLLSISGLVACASLELESPGNVDLSGKWVLDAAASQEVILPVSQANAGGPPGVRKGGKGGGLSGQRGGQRGGHGERGGQGKGGERGGRSKNSGGKAEPKPDSMNSTEMFIEHASDSMGVMYQSGNYRDVDWGVSELRNKTISAGWKGELLSVKTKSPRTTVTEVYQLLDNGRLAVTFKFDGKEYVRLFDRQSQTAK